MASQYDHQELLRQARAKAAPATFTLGAKVLPDFLDMEIDPQSNLLGNRWLTREGSLFVVAPSGHGKSSFVIQCAAHWSIGRPAFGIKPARPLKILILESEDDDADNKAFVQFLRTMSLSAHEVALMRENTRLEFRRDLTGERFFSAIDQFLAQYQPDILFINPLTGFCTVELKDEIGMNDFLRNRLNSIMEKHHCAPIIVAHMPKHQVSSISGKEWFEWMYVQSGAATLTNWARAILVFVPTKTRGTYRFIAAKRPSQSGWLEPEYFFSHSRELLQIDDGEFEIIQWVPATSSQIQDAAPEPKPRKINVSSDLIHHKMSPLKDYSRDSFRVWCRETFNIGRDFSDTYLRSMVQDGLIEALKGDGNGAAKLTTFRKLPK